MIWFRDVVGLIVKGLLFGALPAAICCYEGLVLGSREDERGGAGTTAAIRPTRVVAAWRCPSSEPPACRSWRS